MLVTLEGAGEGGSAVSSSPGVDGRGEGYERDGIGEAGVTSFDAASATKSSSSPMIVEFSQKDKRRSNGDVIRAGEMDAGKKEEGETSEEDDIGLENVDAKLPGESEEADSDGERHSPSKRDLIYHQHEIRSCECGFSYLVTQERRVVKALHLQSAVKRVHI